LKFLPPEDDIELYEDGFGENDILGRKVISSRLSELVDRIEDPLVIAIDGPWGSGKSYFLKRWVGAHTKENSGKATTVYFDAFSHDYLDEPLIGLVSAIGDRLPPEGKRSQWDRIRKAAIKLAKPIAKIGLSAATAGAAGIATEFWEGVIESGGKEFETVLDKFWAKEEGRRAAMNEFRAALAMLTGPDDNGVIKPIVVVIDELDRCRPDYALQVLEIIKHFFTVAGVHFLLGVNMRVLEGSVRARYGQSIDSHGYLKRFINLTLNLPSHIGNREKNHTVILYADHLSVSMGLDNMLSKRCREHLKLVMRSNEVSIRDVGKIMSRVSLVPEKMRVAVKLSGWQEILVTLIISAIIRPELYPKFLNGSISDDELLSYFGATKEMITLGDNGRQTEHHHHPTFYLVHMWRLISSSGKEDIPMKDSFEKIFSEWGISDSDPKLYPRKVHDDWLDLFSISQ